MDGNVSVEMNETKKLRDTTAVIALLAETFPKCFSVYEGRRRPLKLKIHVDIQTTLDGAITPAELHKALGAYCSNRVYLSHTCKGAAKATLAGIRAKKEARTATVQPAVSQLPKRLSLADLKAAALARTTGVSLPNN
jgi:sRNA-binding protein